MISRLTAYAIAFACVATTTIGWAATSRQTENRATSRAAISHQPSDSAMAVVRLETVVVTARRNAPVAK